MGAGNEFDPADFIKETFIPLLDPYRKRRIAQAVLSHPHSDHIDQCGVLKEGTLYPELLTCPNDKGYPDGTESREKLNWKRIKNPKGSGDLIDSYKMLFKARELPLRTILFESNRTVPNLEYGVFYVRPPVCEKIHESDDNRYGNSTSLVFYLRHGDHSILLPADMTPEGMEHILEERRGTEKRYTIFDREISEARPNWHRETSDQPSLKSLPEARGLSVLVAPHHGLESGFSSAMYDAMKGGRPGLVVISERRHKKDTDGSIHPTYQSERGASGLTVEVEGKEEKNRRTLSTINGNHILVVFSGTGTPKVYAYKDTNKLLSKISS